MLCDRCGREIDKFEEERAEVRTHFIFPHKIPEFGYSYLCEKCIEEFMEFMKGGEG